ncbi:tol-pal system protein YbgF [Posidoniimonas corsicana]|uniref:Tol-pal system protein YbgF n=1 Tax=Posidoniimonas corsicana TaxID=1938618 RepID=A0A5C5VBQ9_9BACT|nr:tetratricopeptide repeat protein [Posidoniimonas corsicana]TWT36054.1 tol-pal system protein YbgF [Posidoniimonas corsicana]
MLAASAPAQQPAKPSPEAARAYASAAALQDRGLHDLAAKEWQTLLKEFPADALAPRAEYNLGVCRFQQGEYAKAVQAFEQAARHAKDDAVAEGAWSNLGLARFNQAASLASKQQAAAAYGSAVEAFDQLLAKFPKSTQAGGAQFYRGEAMTALGQFDRAADSYRAALADDAAAPLHVAARLGLASAELELGQPDQAEATLNTLIAAGAVGQTGGEAHTLRGEARLAAGKPAAAANDFAQAAAVDGYAAADHAQERRGFALYSAGDHAAAAQAYQELARKFPQSPLAPGATLAAGKCLLLAGQREDAAFLLGALWRSDPTAGNAESAHWLVQALAAAGKPDQLVEPARQALATNPAEEFAGPLRFALADALTESPTGRVEALRLYQQIAQRDRGESGQRAAYLAAHTAIQLKQHEQALRLAEQFLQRHAGSEWAAEARLVAAEAAAQLGQTPAAIKHYQQLLAAKPDDDRSADWTLRLASLLRADSQWDQLAEMLAARLPTLPPDRRSDALVLLSEARQQMGDASASIAALGSLIEQSTDDARVAQALYQRGELLTAAGQLDAANRDFAAVAQNHGRHELAPYALYSLANNQMQAGGKAAGIATLRRLVTDYQQGPVAEARFTLAGLLHEQNQDAEALKLLDAAKAPPADLSYLRALCLLGAGRTEDARSELTALLKNYPQHANADQAVFELAWMRRETSPSEAAAQFKRLAADYPQSPLGAESLLRAGELLYEAGEEQQAVEPLKALVGRRDAQPALRAQANHLLGWVRFDSGDYAAAAQAFAAQLNDEPAGAVAATGAAMLGESHFAQQQHQPAIDAYARAIDPAPSDNQLAATAWLHAGQAAAQLGRWEDSLAWLDRAGQADQAGSQSDQIRYERAWALVNLNRTQEARPLFESLIQSKDGVLSARSQFMLGEMQFANKEHQAAVRTFFRVAYGYGGRDAPEEYHPWQAESLFEAGRCLEALGRKEPAQKLYVELLERFPDSAKARHARARLQQGVTR